MSEISKGALTSENNNSFPNNNTGYITPTILRTFNQNMIDSLVDEISYAAESASFNSRINDLDPSGSQQNFNALEAATASLNAYTASQNTINSSVTASIVALQSFSSSLDATFATDAQLTALSSSVAVTTLGLSGSVAALQQFSSSLDSTFATDAQLNAATASLVLQINTKLNTASYQTDSASFDGRIDSLESWSSSLDSGYVTEVEFGAYTSSNDSKVNSLINATASYAISSSVSTALDGKTDKTTFNSYTSSNDSKVNELISKTGSYATTGSNIFNGNQSVTGSVSLTGTITATSASFQYVETVFETASVIYSSGSNQFGDASNDVQTLYGSVRVMNALTASGLNYPTADNGAKSFVQTDGAGNLSLQYVDAVFETVRNSSGVTLSKGTPVYISGSTGDNGNAYVADASDASKMPAMFILGEDLNDGDTGIALVSGLIEGVNTSVYAAGTEIYVAEGGGWTSNRPTGSASVVQKLGVVTKQGVGGQGVVINQLEAELPNLQTNYVWVGNGTNQPVAVLTSSLNAGSSSFATSASFAVTASYVIGFDSSSLVQSSTFNSYTSSNDSKVNSLTAATSSYAVKSANNTFTGTNLFNNNVEVGAGYQLTLTKIVPNTSAGIIIDSGVNQDVLIPGRKTRISNDLIVTGSVTSSTGFRGDLVGTASFATTASYALNATSVDTSSLVTTSSFNSYTQSNDSKWDTLGGQTGSFITESETGSMSVASASFATTASFALNATSINTGSFATTGSNIFLGNQFITGAILQSSSLANEMTRLQIAKSNKPFYGTADTLLSLVGDSSGVFDFYADGGNFDTLNIEVAQNGGTIFKDWNGSSNQNWLKIPTNTGNNPAPQFQRGLGVTGSFIASGSTHIFNGNVVFNNGLTSSAARINGDIVATGNITATSASFQYVETVYETASIIYSSGSNQLGDELSDVQTLSGSVKVQGSLLVNGVHVQTSSFDASGYLLTSSFNSYTQSNDSVVNALVAATSSYVTETESGSFVTNVSAGLGANILNIFKGDGSVNTLTIDNVTSASYADLALTASFAENTNTSSLLITASISGDTITFTKGNGSTFPIVVPTSSGSVPSGTVSSSAQITQFGFATTGSNIFIGNQFITGALLQSSSLPNEFTRVQIARSNKAFFGEANTLLSLVGDSQGIFDFYADGGNYDTLNVVVNQNGGTTFRDWTGAAYNNWLVIPTNTGANPAPQFKRGLGITGSMALSGSSTITDGEMSFYNNIPNANAIRVYSGSVEITSPQGTGRFYSNLPMTSSGLRINGTALVGDLIVSGVFAGDSSLQVLGNAAVSGSTFFGNQGGDNHIFTGSVRVDGEIYRLGEQVATQGPNNFVGDQKITGSLRVDGDFFLDDDGGTTQFLMNAKYFTEFKGIATRWQEASKTASVDMGEGNIALLYYAYGTGYDNGFHTDIDSSGTTFSDYNTSYTKKPWLKILPNPNTDPAPQFQRGLGITGSLVQSGSVNITGSVNGNVSALSISSQTASMNLNNGNFFTLQLVSGSNTHIVPSNIKPGQTISLLLNTTGSGTVSFPSSIKQASGSAYVPTTGTGVDVLTLISFDTQSLYISNLKNFN